jgi:Mg/Co/Ni transporter MgtE
MVTRFGWSRPTNRCPPSSTACSAVSQDDVPVVDGGRLAGLLGRTEALTAAFAGRLDAPMRRDAPAVSESDSLELAFDRLQSSGERCIPVVRGDAVVGLLPVDNIAYVLRMRERSGGLA